ncbi:hypothetical protein [[Mycobacterium] nativiensis]|uniref:Uncharacterized protein n=1 Tax=[Mycobacterium] nativiensis TaxID=2855503 RepID=A0ABU5Y692_9MYCO|nr:hypothetical protein [Mycolicibacter sp. MYC340]MEB3034781.1 hypothetical protein [Mycolicibacter sp. MYC340]
MTGLRIEGRLLITESERILRAQIGAHTSWANTEDRTARTRNARAKFNERFDDEVDPDRVLSPEERTKRADSARKAYFARLAFKSATARRARRSGGA